MFAFFTSAH